MQVFLLMGRFYKSLVCNGLHNFLLVLSATDTSFVYVTIKYFELVISLQALLKYVRPSAVDEPFVSLPVLDGCAQEKC